MLTKGFACQFLFRQDSEALGRIRQDLCRIKAGLRQDCGGIEAGLRQDCIWVGLENPLHC